MAVKGQAECIIAIQLHCGLRGLRSRGGICRKVLRPSLSDAEDMPIGCVRMGRCIARIMCQSLAQQLARSEERTVVHPIELIESLQRKIVGCHAARMLAHAAAEFALAHMRRDRANDPHGDAVLQVEQIRQVAVEPVRPNQVTRLGFAKLYRDAKPVSRSAETAMQHVADVQLVADAAKIEWRTSEAKRGAARDDQQFFQAAKQADDVVHHALGEIRIGPVLQQCTERQHGK